jgi:HEAT repeat protein
MGPDDPAREQAGLDQRIALLVADVEAADLEQRRAAVWQIFEMCFEARERAASAIPVLLNCLSDPDKRVGEGAAGGLHWCAPASIEPLIDCLNDPRPIVRRRACDALGNIGEPAIAACDVLRRSLTDTEPEVRAGAAKALGLIHDTHGRTIDALFAMASSESTRGRSAALHALGNIGKALADPGPLQAREHEVLAALEDSNADVRWSACYVLESLGLDPERHVELLMRRFAADTSEHVLGMATGQLRRLTSTIDPEAHLLLMCHVVRAAGRPARDMCEALALLGPRAGAAIPCLIDALRSDDVFLVVEAAKALWRIAGRAAEAVPELARVFDDSEESVCDAICEIGPAAEPLVDKVIGALDSGDWDLQWAAADALGAIGSSRPDVVAALATALGHPSPIVRSAAGRALAAIGPATVPALIEILEAPDDDDRREWAADALGQMGAQAHAAIEPLKTRWQSADRALAAWCAIALAKIAGDAATVPTLIGLLARSDRPDLQQQAALALTKIGPPAASATQALEAALRDLDADDEHGRAAIKGALAAIGGALH